MIEDIRKKLDKVTGELLESFIPFDKRRVLKFQAGLHAIHAAQKDLETDKKTNLYAVCDDLMLEKLLSEHGISKNDLDKVPDAIASYSDNPKETNKTLEELPNLLQQAVYKVSNKKREIYEIPASGMIAVTLNLVNSDAKDALIAGQAGERTLQAIERISKKKEGKNKEYYSSTAFSAPYHDSNIKEPGYLTLAKATNHLADIFENAISKQPKITNDSIIKASLNAFRYIIKEIFKQSSNRLKESGVEEASASIAKLAESLSSTTGEVASHASAINAIKQGLEVIKNNPNLTDADAEYFETVVNKRLEQLKDFESV
ncbi:MAG: hypothetical protein K0R98_864 [Rickettsiaceae bacterium]|jgi:hypothetical protein|nr:hypothetical protein [Rickettsiaceae bacterium]